MQTEGKLSLADVFVGIRYPRQAKKAEDVLVELLVIAVCGVLAGADDFVEIEEWAKEKRDWFGQYLRLEHGIPSHDTFGRVFATIDADMFGAAFRRWVSSIAPNLGKGEVVAIDGKTSRRSGKVDATPLHLVSAFAAGAPGFDTSPRFSPLFGKCLQRRRGFEGRDRKSAVVARL